MVSFMLRVIYPRGICRGGLVWLAADLGHIEREVNILLVSEIEPRFL